MQNINALIGYGSHVRIYEPYILKSDISFFNMKNSCLGLAVYGIAVPVDCAVLPIDYDSILETCVIIRIIFIIIIQINMI